LDKVQKRWIITKTTRDIQLIVEELQDILLDRTKIIEMLVTLHLISEHKDLVEMFTEKYVEANIIDLPRILEQIKEYDLEDLISFYSWEMSKEVRRFKLPNILSRDIWLRMLELFRNQGIKDLLLITDSVVLGTIFLRVFKEYCSGVILVEESPYREIFREYLKKYRKNITKNKVSCEIYSLRDYFSRCNFRGNF